MTDTPDNATATEKDQATPLEQTVTLEDIGPASKRLTIEIPESRIQTHIEDGFTSLQKDAVLPGFRRGRAPQRLIRKRFGESIRDDARGQLIAESYTQAIEEKALKVLGEPQLKDAEEIKLPESGPLTVVFEMEVEPDIQLPDFASLKITRTKVEVTDADVEGEIERSRESLGRIVEIDDKQVKVASGDYVDCALRILPGHDPDQSAVAIVDLPSAYALVHGEEREFKGHIAGILVDDLGKHLIDRQPGDVVQIAMTGPQSHENDQIRDQPITLVVTINSLHRLEPASLDALCEAMHVESEQAVQERMRQTLETRREREQSQAMHQQAMDQLRKAVAMELPEKVTGQQAERLLSRRRHELLYQGVSENEVESQLAELRSSTQEEAAEELKSFFILNKAADTLKVDVSEQELNNRIAMQAMQTGRRPEKVRQEMIQNGQMQSLFLSLREQKTLDEIIKQVTVEDIDAPASDEDQTAEA